MKDQLCDFPGCLRLAVLPLHYGCVHACESHEILFKIKSDKLTDKQRDERRAATLNAKARRFLEGRKK